MALTSLITLGFLPPIKSVGGHAHAGRDKRRRSVNTRHIGWPVQPMSDRQPIHRDRRPGPIAGSPGVAEEASQAANAPPILRRLIRLLARVAAAEHRDATNRTAAPQHFDQEG
jgi:hypothetical protein